jgi:hypothetical protein
VNTALRSGVVAEEMHEVAAAGVRPVGDGDVQQVRRGAHARSGDPAGWSRVDIVRRTDGKEGGPVLLEIRLASVEAFDDTLELWRELDENPELRAAGGVRRAPVEHRPGGMGLALDMIQFVAGSALAVASLVVAVAGWREQRRARTELPGGTPMSVTIRADGIEVVVESADPEHVRKVVEQLTEPRDGLGPA